jgi:DNA polymerase
MDATPATQPGGSPDRSAAALDALREQAAGCRACPLWEIGTQTVFGAGPANAELLFIGEAPGQQEDRSGVPFVGPAGQLFDEALEAAGIDRSRVYVTNAVKHRPWVRSDRGRQKNRAPKASEVKACAQWLDAELALIRPRVVCCLGAVAARRILGREFRLMEQRGTWTSTDAIPAVLATVHPSFVLIQPADSRERWMRTLIDDLRLVRERLDAAG